MMKKRLFTSVVVLVIMTTMSAPAAGASGDDQFWSPVGGGLTQSYYSPYLRPSALALYPFLGSLVVGGDFVLAGGTVVSGVARWNGSSWSALPPGFNMEAATFTMYGGLLTAGGRFTASPMGGIALRKIASFNGTAWTDMGTTSFYDSTVILSFCECNGMLYAGGRGQGLPLAFLHPSMGWVTGMLGAGFDEVRSLTCKGDTLWAATPYGLPYWVNVTYKGTSTGGDVRALLRTGDSLIVIGTFFNASLPGETNVALVRNGIWTQLGYDFNASPFAVAVYDGQIVVGGPFTMIGGVPFAHIAALRDGIWQPLGSGTDSTVTSLAVYNNDLYVGGRFLMAGGDSAKAIARWSKKLACCMSTVGNVDCDQGDGVDVSDVTALIDNLFISFETLCCEGEANCDGLGGIDVADVTALIDNLFITFTPLPGCQ